MALDIYFRDDIANALMAADEASASTAAALRAVTSDPQYLRAYRQGYRAALASVACAFGLNHKSPRHDMPSMGPEPTPSMRSPVLEAWGEEGRIEALAP